MANTGRKRSMMTDEEFHSASEQEIGSMLDMERMLKKNFFTPEQKAIIASGRRGIRKQIQQVVDIPVESPANDDSRESRAVEGAFPMPSNEDVDLRELDSAIVSEFQLASRNRLLKEIQATRIVSSDNKRIGWFNNAGMIAILMGTVSLGVIAKLSQNDLIAMRGGLSEANQKGFDWYKRSEETELKAQINSCSQAINTLQTYEGALSIFARPPFPRTSDVCDFYKSWGNDYALAQIACTRPKIYQGAILDKWQKQEASHDYYVSLFAKTCKTPASKKK